jgi:hypothetical protein
MSPFCPALPLSDVRRTNNATIEVIIEDSGFNNSLAGYLNCPQAWSHNTGKTASLEWQSHYLKDGGYSSRDTVGPVADGLQPRSASRA